jgi:hypothetical protein
LTVREFSKENKLNEISDNEETVEKSITNLFGEYFYPASFEGAIINNGRIYDTKTPDQILESYLVGLEKNISSTELSEIMESYYYSIYSRNPKKLNESIIKLKAKPFFHWQPDKLQLANVNEVDYLKNLYFDEFYTYYEQNVEEMGISTLDKVQASFDVWIKEKQPLKPLLQAPNQVINNNQI